MVKINLLTRRKNIGYYSPRKIWISRDTLLMTFSEGSKRGHKNRHKEGIQAFWLIFTHSEYNSWKFYLLVKTVFSCWLWVICKMGYFQNGLKFLYSWFYSMKIHRCPFIEVGWSPAERHRNWTSSLWVTQSFASRRNKFGDQRIKVSDSFPQKHQESW